MKEQHLPDILKLYEKTKFCEVNFNESNVIHYTINVNTTVQMLTPNVIVNEVNYNDPNVIHDALINKEVNITIIG